MATVAQHYQYVLTFSKSRHIKSTLLIELKFSVIIQLHHGLSFCGSAVAGQNALGRGGQHGRAKPKGSGGKTPENF